MQTRWLTGHARDQRNKEAIRGLKTILLALLSFLLLYFFIITIVGYKPNGPRSIPSTASATSTDTTDHETYKGDTTTYFRITGLVFLVVIGITIGAVLRESPVLSMLSAIFFLMAVTQSMSNVFNHISTSYAFFHRLAGSPAAFLTLGGVLLTIYTAIIWASEFETPPSVIEEYKWYLNQIRPDPGYDYRQKLTVKGSSGQSSYSQEVDFCATTSCVATDDDDSEEDKVANDFTVSNASYYSSNSKNIKAFIEK